MILDYPPHSNDRICLNFPTLLSGLFGQTLLACHHMILHRVHPPPLPIHFPRDGHLDDLQLPSTNKAEMHVPVHPPV